MSFKYYFYRSPQSNLLNLWLYIKSIYRYLSNKSTDDAIPPADYQLVFSEDFKVIDPFKWCWGQPYGNFNPDRDWLYWPKMGECPSELVYATPDGVALELRKYPKWIKGPGTVAKSNWAAGLISSRHGYRCAWIEAEIKLSSGTAQTAEFSIGSFNPFSPKIDIFVSKHTSNPNLVQVSSSIRWGGFGFKELVSPYIPINTSDDKFIKYAIHWTPTQIQIYYDGALVNTCDIQDAVRQENQRLHIILNNGCLDPRESGISPGDSAMLVRSVKVYQHPEWIKNKSYDLDAAEHVNY